MKKYDQRVEYYSGKDYRLVTSINEQGPNFTGVAEDISKIRNFRNTFLDDPTLKQRYHLPDVVDKDTNGNLSIFVKEQNGNPRYVFLYTRPGKNSDEGAIVLEDLQVLPWPKKFITYLDTYCDPTEIFDGEIEKITEKKVETKIDCENDCQKVKIKVI